MENHAKWLHVHRRFALPAVNGCSGSVAAWSCAAALEGRTSEDGARKGSTRRIGTDISVVLKIALGGILIPDMLSVYLNRKLVIGMRPTVPPWSLQ